MLVSPGQDWLPPETPSSLRFPGVQRLQSRSTHSWFAFVPPGLHLQLGATTVGTFGACHCLSSLPADEGVEHVLAYSCSRDYP